MNPQETIMEQFKVIEDAVRELKEMMDTPATKESLGSTGSYIGNIPQGYDNEGNTSFY
jgi:hypothetical protein